MNDQDRLLWVRNSLCGILCGFESAPTLNAIVDEIDKQLKTVAEEKTCPE